MHGHLTHRASEAQGSPADPASGIARRSFALDTRTRFLSHRLVELRLASARASCLALGALCALAGLGPARAEPSPLSAEEVSRRWHGRLDGRHFTARLTVEATLDGRIWNDVLTLWRDDRNGERERLVVHYEEPEDLRGTMLLYLENHGRPTDYFIFQPHTGRVRRTSEAVIRSNVQGMDMEYLGFGLAPSEPTTLDGLDLVELDGRPTFRLREKALREDARFAERTVWVDRETFIPMRVEHTRQGTTTFIGQVGKVETISGIETPVSFRAEYPTARRKLQARVAEVDYESEIPDEFFSTVRLVRPK